jgi:hypothetical protein
MLFTSLERKIVSSFRDQGPGNKKKVCWWCQNRLQVSLIGRDVPLGFGKCGILSSNGTFE